MPNWVLGDRFTEEYGHQGSIKKLWEMRWQAPCLRSVYPFHDGKFADFEPLFAQLIEKEINDPFSDEYTKIFNAAGQQLALQASSLIQQDKSKAMEFFMRANAVLRIGRFPYIGTELKRGVFETQKQVYLRGAKLWDIPVTETVIHHKYAADGDGPSIPLYLRVPLAASSSTPCPVVLLITGLDGHRPDNTERTEEHLKRGWATVICDIPGTTVDCPALKTDPLSPDRLFSSILEWIDEQPQFNSKKVIAWGLSAGGYYAIRVAHTHAQSLAGAIGHGSGTHHYIGREWLEQVSKHEYPFGLERAYCQKYGYKDFEEMKEKCQKTFSLISGEGKNVAVVKMNMKSCRLLLINGMLDGCMPIEDSMLLAEYGSPKEMRFIRDRLHMGYPEANSHVYPWMESIMKE